VKIWDGKGGEVLSNGPLFLRITKLLSSLFSYTKFKTLLIFNQTKSLKYNPTKSA